MGDVTESDNIDDFFDRLEAEYPTRFETAVEVDPPFDLAENVLRIRTERGMTQAALAEAAGIAQPRIAEIESGESNPRLSTIAKLARVLGVYVVDLLTPPPDLRRPAAAPALRPDAAPAEDAPPVRRRKAG